MIIAINRSPEDYYEIDPSLVAPEFAGRYRNAQTRADMEALKDDMNRSIGITKDMEALMIDRSLPNREAFEKDIENTGVPDRDPFSSEYFLPDEQVPSEIAEKAENNQVINMGNKEKKDAR